MKVQRDKKISAACGRKQGGENQRFSPGNWAYAQFLTDFNAACGSGKGGENLRFSPGNWAYAQFLTILEPPFGGRKRGRNGKNENAGSDASGEQHGGDEGI